MKNLRLLKIEEAKQLPKRLLVCDYWYWLEPYKGSTKVSYVDMCGTIRDCDEYKILEDGGVRLVSECDVSLKLNSSLMYNGIEFIVFEHGKAISKSIVTKCVYSYSGLANYDESYVKEVLDSLSEEPDKSDVLVAIIVLIVTTLFIIISA